MEHPYLFLVKVFEWFGPGAAHFAHAYPYVIYSWFVMIFLIVCAAIATKGISMIPTKGQNFFEIVISGMEEFMVDITGEEGRWLFPDRRHPVPLYCGVQPERSGTGILPADRQHQHDPFLRPGRWLSSPTSSDSSITVPNTSNISSGPVWWMIP